MILMIFFVEFFLVTIPIRYIVEGIYNDWVVLFFFSLKKKVNLRKLVDCL